MWVSIPPSMLESQATSPEVEWFKVVEYLGLEPSSAFLQGMRGCPVPTPKNVGAFRSAAHCILKCIGAVSSHHDEVLVSPLGNDPRTYCVRARCSAN
jgi:hypothetical protein